MMYAAGFVVAVHHGKLQKKGLSVGFHGGSSLEKVMVMVLVLTMLVWVLVSP